MGEISSIEELWHMSRTYHEASKLLEEAFEWNRDELKDYATNQVL